MSMPIRFANARLATGNSTGGRAKSFSASVAAYRKILLAILALFRFCRDGHRFRSSRPSPVCHILVSLRLGPHKTILEDYKRIVNRPRGEIGSCAQGLIAPYCVLNAVNAVLLRHPCNVLEDSPKVTRVRPAG